MKRLLLLLLVPSFSTAWQYYSFEAHRYYTLPKHNDINEQQYHELSCLMSLINREMINAKMCYEHRFAVIEKYLKNLKTATSLRLLADLKELAK